MTIAAACQEVLKSTNMPMTPGEIYDEIMKRDLFKFGAQNPTSVVAQTLRKKSNANPKATQILFTAVEKGKYMLAK